MFNIFLPPQSKFFEYSRNKWGEKHVKVYVLVGHFKSEFEFFLINKNAAS